MNQSELRKHITETLQMYDTDPNSELSTYGEAANVVTELMELFDIFAGGQ